jgi:hypothetical protein
MIQPPILGAKFREMVLTTYVNYLLPESVLWGGILRLRN